MALENSQSATPVKTGADSKVDEHIQIASLPPQQPQGQPITASAQEQSPQNYQYYDLAWHPGILRRFPWLAALCLLGAVLTIAGTSVVLTWSDGQAVDEWPTRTRPIQPAVILAVLGAIANVLLLVAVREGGTIAWWVRVIGGGPRRGGLRRPGEETTTLGDCHRAWAHGQSVWAAATSGHFDRIALGTLLLAVVVIDGPLLQRASTVVTRNSVATRPVVIAAAIPETPFPETWWSGIYMTRGSQPNVLSPNFSRVYRDYTARTPILLPGSSGGGSGRGDGCTGTCQATLVAQGWDIACSQTERPYNITPVAGKVDQVGAVNVTFGGLDHPDTMRVETLYKASRGPVGMLSVTTCDLHAALVSYAVQIANSTVTLLQPTSIPPPNTSIELLYPRSETSGFGVHASRLGGIFLATQTLHQSNISLYFTVQFAIEATGPMAYTHMTSEDDALASYDMTWGDPMLDVLTTIRELTFRAAVSLSNATTPIQRIAADETVVLAVYRSNYAYLAGALAVMIACLLGTLPLFDGFWRLGRQVSLSPIEIARAFQAPVLADVHSNRPVHELLREVGNRRVRYGMLPVQIWDESRGEYIQGTSLAMADPAFISVPPTKA